MEEKHECGCGGHDHDNNHECGEGGCGCSHDEHSVIYIVFEDDDREVPCDVLGIFEVDDKEYIVHSSCMRV